ncbi:MAG: SAM-dependent methyltransferase [Trebonia sp.]
MTSDEAPGADDGASKVGPLPFDITKAHQARSYDYYLGGKDNYAADRSAVDEHIKIVPNLVFTMQANRAFLGLAVRYLAREAGIRQFLDIGTGIPTAGNVHEVAQAIAPESRVVYVDYDPVVLAHARALLDSSEVGATEYIDADLRNTGTILSQAADLLDFTKPVAVTLISILHALPDADDPHAIVAQIMDAVPSGSYLAISHFGQELLSPETLEALMDSIRRTSRQQYTSRTRAQLARFFDGTDLVEPGLVPVEEWRPDPGADGEGKSLYLCAVGQKITGLS